MAIDAGVTHEAWWRQTPRETAECLRSHARRRREDRELALWAAWHHEGFARTKELPELAPILARVRGENRDGDDAEAQLAAARAIHAAFGGGAE